MVWTLDDSKILVTWNDRVGDTNRRLLYAVCFYKILFRVQSAVLVLQPSTPGHVWENTAAPLWLACQCCQKQGRDRGKERLHLSMGPRRNWMWDLGNLSASPSRGMVVRHQQEQTKTSGLFAHKNRVLRLRNLALISRFWKVDNLQAVICLAPKACQFHSFHFLL